MNDGPGEAALSTWTPGSNRSKMSGEQGEDIPSHDKVKTDPNEPADKKRAHVEGQVNKRLGPEDHQ